MDINVTFEHGTPEEEREAKQMIERVIAADRPRADEGQRLHLFNVEVADVEVVHNLPLDEEDDEPEQTWDEVKASGTWDLVKRDGRQLWGTLTGALSRS
jgi:hypothetical protein